MGSDPSREPFSPFLNFAAGIYPWKVTGAAFSRSLSYEVSRILTYAGWPGGAAWLLA